MKVNDGSIKVTLDYKEVSMDELVRQSLSLTNTNPYIVNKKANIILLNNGRNRLVEGVYAHDSEFDYNPYDDIEVLDESYKMLHNINSNEQLIRVVRAISYMTVTIYKKSLVMSFLNSGQHISYSEAFRLEEEIIPNEMEYDEQTRQQMEYDNKFINSKIKDFIKFYYDRSNQMWDWFYENVTPMSDYPEELKMFLEQRSTMLSDVNQNQWKKSDVDKAIINAKAGHILELDNDNSDILDEDEDESEGTEYLIRREEVQNFRTVLTGFREELEKARNIPFKDSAPAFDINVSTARKHRPKAYEMFYDISGLSDIVLPDIVD